MQNEISKNIITLYLAGQATSMQKEQIKDWLKEEKNLHQYYQWVEEWENDHPQFLPDVNVAIQSFFFKINNPYLSEKSNLHQNHKVGVYQESMFNRNKRWWMSAAATITFLSLVYFLFRETIIQRTFETQYGEVKSFSLPDGSNVTLNANSSLSVPRFGFGAKSRKVFLQGEAVFSVTHTKDDKKFVVLTPDRLEVEVLGTRFSVYARKNRSTVKLEKGLVKVNLYKDRKVESLIIKPGDVLSVKDAEFKIKHAQPVKDFFAWKEHRFVFDSTYLSQAVLTLEESFGIPILIEDSALRTKTVTGSFRAENADDLLNAFVQIYNIKIEKTEGKFRLQLIE